MKFGKLTWQNLCFSSELGTRYITIITCLFHVCCLNWILVTLFFYVPGESLGTSQDNRNQDSCSRPEDGPGVLYFAAWFLWHGFWSHFQKHWQSQKVMFWKSNFRYALCHIFSVKSCFSNSLQHMVAVCLKKVVIGKGRIGWKCMKACTACPLEISRRLLSCFWILFQPLQPMNSFLMTPSYFIRFWPALYHWIEFP